MRNLRNLTKDFKQALRDNHIDIKIIKKTTGLTEDEIEELA